MATMSPAAVANDGGQTAVRAAGGAAYKRLRRLRPALFAAPATLRLAAADGLGFACVAPGARFGDARRRVAHAVGDDRAATPATC